ncbi:BglG family transcription antiterminator [Clostridium oceanicum]|uniref:BglG family transcription antiterminator n=1 Tax=Clostridium oceanicum TaxID=1543 RepID=A0ABP3UTM0_9CLOT
MREKIILEKLIESNNYISLDFFSQRLGVTTRTTRKHMKNLIDSGKTNGFSMEFKRKEGYYLKIKDKKLMNEYLKKLDKFKVDEDPKQRVKKILFILLTSVEYVTVSKFSNILSVSRSTIIKEIKEVENKIHSYNLRLIKKRYYGLIIEGEEEKIREAILREYIDNYSDFWKKYFDFMSKEDYLDIENKIIKEMKNNQVITENRNLKYILFTIKISIYRMKKGKYIKDVKRTNSKKLKSYINISRNTLNFIKEKFDIEFSESEVLNLAIKINSKCSKIYKTTECNEDLKKYIEEFLYKLDLEYDSVFSKDKELVKSLWSHIQALIERLYQNVKLKNPIADEISMKYSTTFDIAIKFSKMIQNMYNLSLTKDEIAYITMHFAAHIEKRIMTMISNLKNIAVICSSGGGSSYLLKLKLQNLFYSSNIKTFSFFEIDEVNEFNPNLIISIVKLNKEDFNKPIIYVKELIDDKELLKIKDVLETEFYLKNNGYKKNHKDIEMLFEKQFFKVMDNKASDSYIDIIYKRAKEFEISNYAKGNYAKYVMEREKLFSTIYKNMIAAPHPIEMCGNKNSIGVTILKEPIEYKGKKVRVIFLICLKEHQLTTHKKISKFLIDAMEKKEFNNKMVKVKSYEDFIIEIKNILK